MKPFENLKPVSIAFASALALTACENGLIDVSSPIEIAQPDGGVIPPVIPNQPSTVPDFYSMDRSGTITMTPLDNDIEGASLTIVNIIDGDNGIFNIGALGKTINFTADEEFVGIESFNYIAADVAGNLFSGSADIDVIDTAVVPDPLGVPLNVALRVVTTLHESGNSNNIHVSNYTGGAVDIHWLDPIDNLMNECLADVGQEVISYVLSYGVGPSAYNNYISFERNSSDVTCGPTDEYHNGCGQFYNGCEMSVRFPNISNN